MDNIDNVVVSSRVRLARNVEGVPFPRRMRENDQATFDILLTGVKNAIGNDFEYNYYDMSALPDVSKQALMERHLISHDLMANSDNGKAIISRDQTISIMINEEDHIREQCLLPGYQLEAAYNKINGLDDELSKNLKFAFDERLGYLTSCPTNLGTGMRASAMMFLPGLTILGTIDNFFNTAGKLGLTARGIYGEGSDADGYLYQISNEVSLGISEQDILRRVDTFVNRVAESELRAREILLEKEGVTLIDKICRAYGILTNAYMISTDESLRLLSLLKIGVSGNIIKDVAMRTLNTLTDGIGSGEICVEAGRILSSVERDIERAKKIKKYLTKSK